MEAALKPEALDTLDRKIQQLVAEKAHLLKKSGTDRTAAQCLVDIQTQLILLRKSQKEVRRARGLCVKKNAQPVHKACSQ